MTELKEMPERAIAVGYGKKGYFKNYAEEHLNEIIALAETAGAKVIETFYQELESINTATAIGKGKMEEIGMFIEDNDIQLVIFDDDLSPVQLKNLELAFKVKVIDRSWLILDIFALRAQSNEAKLQVELAQLKYLMPRLTRMWTHLSKQYGGIGTKGPGETQIETDRRLIKLRIQKLEQKLEEIETQRIQQKKGRDNFLRFAIVGYTNAGKSTLMNLITESGVYAEDKLFATLDTTVRMFTLPSGRKALISDTVGFIRKLPTHLIASFNTTLSEAKESNILIHVIDASNPFYPEHYDVVNETLKNLGIQNKPTINVFNKIDLVEDKFELNAIESKHENSILISAKRGININHLLGHFEKILQELSQQFVLRIPYSDSDKLSKLYEMATITLRTDLDDGYHLEVMVNTDKQELFNNFMKSYLI